MKTQRALVLVLLTAFLTVAGTPSPGLGATAQVAKKQAEQSKKKNTQSAQKGKAVHGRAWAFGHSSDRGAAIWRQGTPVQNLQKQAVQGAEVEKEAVNTTSSIGNALSETDEDKRKKSGLNLSFEKESSVWRKPLPSEPTRPDEGRSMEKNHVVRAFADVQASDDLSISVGPELILKDEKGLEHGGANSSRPDSALGMGMQFELGF